MEGTFEVTLDRQDGFRFRVDFGDGSRTVLQLDEPPPLGRGSGPNASRVLAAAIGNCLTASLLYCLDRARIDVRGVRTRVSGSSVRNESGRLRLGPLKVKIEPELISASPARIERCLEIFEDFCIVTQSVRAGLDVDAEVQVHVPEPVAKILTEAIV